MPISITIHLNTHFTCISLVGGDISLWEWEQASATSKKTFLKTAKLVQNRNLDMVSLEWRRKVEMGPRLKFSPKFPNWARQCILADSRTGNKTSGGEKNLFSVNLYLETLLYKTKYGTDSYLNFHHWPRKDEVIGGKWKAVQTFNSHKSIPLKWSSMGGGEFMNT